MQAQGCDVIGKAPSARCAWLACVLAASLGLIPAGSAAGDLTARRTWAPHFAGRVSSLCAPKRYRVRPGDTLSSIARRFHTSVAALIVANSLDPAGVLPVGLMLVVAEPGCKRRRAAPRAADQGERSLWTSLDRAVRVPGILRARSGVVVVDLDSGTVVYALNPDTPLEPASTEKLPIATAALQRLGRELPNCDRRSWTGDAGRNDLAWRSRAQGLRRSRFDQRRPDWTRASRPRARDHEHLWWNHRRRVVLRRRAHRPRLEALVRESRVAASVGARGQPRHPRRSRRRSSGARSRDPLSRGLCRRSVSRWPAVQPWAAQTRPRFSSHGEPRRGSRLSSPRWTPGATISSRRCC